MKITPYKVRKGLQYLRHYGIKEFLIRVGERLEPDEVPYGPWYDKHKVTKEEWMRQRTDSDSWENRPLISVCVPLFQTPERFLRQMIESVQEQSYTNWQLCLADGSNNHSVGEIAEQYCQKDERIKYKYLDENLGIADNTNEAFLLAEGTWIGLLDHDDILAPDALYEVMSAAQRENVDVVYTDEDKVSEDLNEHFQPHFKPDFNVDLLRSNNYITHFFVITRSIIDKVGGFRSEFDGAQDYDFIFRCTTQANHIAHVAKILYHWRVSPSSTADNPASKQYAFEAGRKAIETHLKSEGIAVEVTQTKDLGFYRVKYPVQGSPLVSIVIPNKDMVEYLQKCISSIVQSSYSNYEIVIVENNSTQAETYAYYETLTSIPYQADKVCEGKLASGNRICVVTWQGEFNYSAINNYGVKYAQGEYLCLLNNDIELITKDWLEEMIGNCQRDEVGIVGVKLLYPDQTVQHAGIVVGIGGIAGNMFVDLKRERSGYMHKASIQLNYSAVTAACLMVERKIYDAVYGMTEELAVAFNDVDFCLKVGRLGYLCVYDPWVLAYHFESKSRGEENTKEKVERFGREIACFQKRWPDILKNGDPYYNSNLSLNKTNYSYKL